MSLFDPPHPPAAPSRGMSSPRTASEAERGNDALPFEAAMAQLEALATRLDDPTLPLDEAVRTYEEGVALARGCLDRLRHAEARVQTLTLE